MSDNPSASRSMTEVLRQTEKMTSKQIKILEAAIELIAEKGYSATSTSEIAKRAGVAEGTIFRHYRTKKDLLLSIVNPVIINFMAPVFAEKFVDQVFHESHTSFEDFLYLFIKNRFEFVQSNVPLIKIVIQELAFHPEIQAAFKKASLEKVFPAIDQTLNVYKEKNQLKNIPNDSIMRMIAPTVIGFLLTRFIIQPDKDWDDDAEIRRTVEYILHGVGK
ncbi:TetR family transcriptional regulator [Lentibacillus populi]|uniref:TetR family transcriptional regulator n=1 Tax=Lentibacillus populi TaxID=1827502 RepID=A0A9W5U0P5_9BACI|nr:MULTISPECIES: TetR/AcrR family transcriptional regulator [Bacillaceae]GGB51917.1 TetR family transcriptional regulator [Lentibacillus populi]